ncbi:MAG: exodeoxyribonuclease V subunit beta [Denitrovibrio sp.]|nr:MAG: exodeoxyribonuclease V subunit beta [Denitrovibrio sp.]
MRERLDVLTAPLRGANLIEANAGTGKTYNITALYARMLVELDFTIESILVVTYTNAAVSDLKGKIHTRLCSLRDAMIAVQSGNKPADDKDFSVNYAIQRQSTLEKDIKTIKGAIRDFDQSSIFTIHGFCQRMLKENAFSGGIPYDVHLTGDSKELIKKPIQDFWRKNAYKSNKAVIPYLLKDSPDELIKFYRGIQSNLSIEVLKPVDFVTETELLEYEANLRVSFEKVKNAFYSDMEEIFRLMDTTRPDFPLKKTSYRVDYVAQSFHEMTTLFTDDNPHCPLEADNKKIHRFTQTAINEKATAKGTIEHPFFSLVENWYNNEERFQEVAKDFSATFRYRLYEYMQEVLEQHKLKNNMQSYDDLIARMRNAVRENEGQGVMTSSLNKKYKAALIDEFQDTDPYQYDIFHTAFGKQNKPFFMIGDPKQAIYSFRGADVFAYLKAATADGKQYTLLDNYRSDPQLVEAINRFFMMDKAFILKQIEYSPSEGASLEMKLVIDGKTEPPVTLWESEDKGAKKEEPINADYVARVTANHISSLLNKSESGNANLNGKRVKPSDIAVLCRSKTQMIKVKNALADCNVPAVVSGSENVFASHEAIELANILSAVISPFNQKAIKTALATPLFGYTADQINGLTETDEWDDITEEFRGYSDIINMKGFAPMFVHLASKRKLYQTIAGIQNGERKLTNYIHITELAQRHEADKKAAPMDILNWLKEAINNSEDRVEEAELKMDSDENAVTIITIHKSKGLEYNIVYSPFLMFYNNKSDGIYKYHDEDNNYMLDMSNSEPAKVASDIEQRAEDIRIAYVALTRATSVCYTAWGNATGNKNSSICYLTNNYSPDSFAGSDVYIKKFPTPDIQMYVASLERPKTANKTFDKTVPSPWQINSFSRLIHSSSAGVKDTDQYTKPDQTKLRVNKFDIFAFPKGAKAGTCLHECMEDTFFENYTKESLLKTVAHKLDLFSFDEDFVPAVADNLLSIIEKDMYGVKLSELEADKYIHEMEFQISTANFTSDAVSEIFSKHVEADFAAAASTLNFNALEGFINGFADLIFEQNGKYYILDWKSNHLGMEIEDYTKDRMHTEMLSSHYYMQLYIYTIALHIHLSNFIVDYDYDTHMGGGLYIFMRGVNHAGTEGIYFHKPKKEIILELAKLVKKP